MKKEIKDGFLQQLMWICRVFVIAGMAAGFKIGSRDKSKFMVESGGKAAMSSSGTPVEFSMEEVTPGNNIIKMSGSSKVVEVQGTGDSVILAEKHGGWSQQFSVAMDQDGSFYILNSGKCLEMDGSGSLSRKACGAKTEQRFEFVTPSSTTPSPNSASETPCIDEMCDNPLVHHQPQVVIIQERGSRPRHKSHGHHGRHMDDIHGIRL